MSRATIVSTSLQLATDRSPLREIASLEQLGSVITIEMTDEKIRTWTVSMTSTDSLAIFLHGKVYDQLKKIGLKVQMVSHGGPDRTDTTIACARNAIELHSSFKLDDKLGVYRRV